MQVSDKGFLFRKNMLLALVFILAIGVYFLMGEFYPGSNIGILLAINVVFFGYIFWAYYDSNMSKKKMEELRIDLKKNGYEISYEFMAKEGLYLFSENKKTMIILFKNNRNNPQYIEGSRLGRSRVNRVTNEEKRIEGLYIDYQVDKENYSITVFEPRTANVKTTKLARKANDSANLIVDSIRAIR